MQQMPQELTYKRTVVYKIATIIGGTQDSNIIDCGGMQLRRITLPSNWDGADIEFSAYEDGTQNTYSRIYNFDGANNNALIIPSTTEGTTIPLFAHFLDSVPYVGIHSSIIQPATTSIILVFQPIYQGVHG